MCPPMKPIVLIVHFFGLDSVSPPPPQVPLEDLSARAAAVAVAVAAVAVATSSADVVQQGLLLANFLLLPNISLVFNLTQSNYEESMGISLYPAGFEPIVEPGHPVARHQAEQDAQKGRSGGG